MSLFSPNFQFKDYTDRARYLLAWRLCLVLCPILLLLTFIFISKNSPNAWSYGGGVVILISCITYMYLSKGYKGFYIATGAMASIVIHYSANAFLDEAHYSDVLWIMLIVMAAYFGVGLIWGTILLITNIAALSYFVFVTLESHIRIYSKVSDIDKTSLMLEFMASTFCIAYVIFEFVKLQRMSEKELIHVNEELEKTNLQISHQNNEKTVLLKEIHHRVKNNLQIIISLLRLQQSELENSEAKSKFTEMTNRVMVMSSIHQKLYQQEDLTNIDLEVYTRELSSELTEVYQAKSLVDIEVKCDYEEIDLKTIVPVGLLLNELMSNSFKYAFKEDVAGQISIDIEDKGENFKLVYSDNGKWKEDDEQRAGFGLELIQILTEQLNGEHRLEKNPTGTTYYFDLKKLN